MVRLVVQRVSKASVSVAGEQIASIGRGLMVLVGIGKDDDKAVIPDMVKKLLSMKLFAKDEDDSRWTETVSSLGLEVLLVSQFTLHATFKGAKPIFLKSMPPDPAREFFDDFVASTRNAYDPGKVQTGKFGNLMEVSLVNFGPVTILLDSDAKKEKE